MKLGILINTDKHAKDLIGLAKAAIAKGHKVIMFFMDSGVQLLSAPEIKELCDISAISMSYCDYTTEKNRISKDDFSDKMVSGSQYNNAIMNNEADRVIIL